MITARLVVEGRGGFLELLRKLLLDFLLELLLNRDLLPHALLAVANVEPKNLPRKSVHSGANANAVVSELVVAFFVWPSLPAALPFLSSLPRASRTLRVPDDPGECAHVSELALIRRRELCLQRALVLFQRLPHVTRPSALQRSNTRYLILCSTPSVY